MARKELSALNRDAPAAETAATSADDARPTGLRVEHIARSFGQRQVVRDVSLNVQRGEVCGLLGPNGAGKTTLISIVCGIVTATEGSVTADGSDIRKDYRKTRTAIGLVPQELTTDAFETVLATVTLSRGLFG